MMIPRSSGFRTGVLALAVVLVPVAGESWGAAAPDSAVVAWLRHAARPIASCALRDDRSDLAGLQGLVGDARLVSLGDANPGTRE